MNNILDGMALHFQQAFTLYSIRPLQVQHQASLSKSAQWLLISESSFSQV